MRRRCKFNITVGKSIALSRAVTFKTIFFLNKPNDTVIFGQTNWNGLVTHIAF